MNRPVIIYHANCWDGFCGAWLFRKAFPDAEFVPAHYGNEPPAVAFDRDRPLYVVDFSYPRDVMFRLAALRRAPVVVLDHHKTAQAALDGLALEVASHNGGDALEITFDMGKSGGRLAWEYLYGGRLLPDEMLDTGWSGYSLGVAPWLVDYTEDRDLWLWSLADSRAVNAAVRSHPLDFAVWDGLEQVRQFSGRWRELIAEGDAILRRESQIVADHVRNARETEMDGHKILCVNATTLFSDIAGELAQDRPFGACYFDRGDGVRQWSLRSRDGGVDVSEVARRRGGGGHRNAAGFQEAIA